MDAAVKFPPVVSAYMQSNARHRFILGPFGSGKSVGSQFEVPRRAAMQARAIQMGDAPGVDMLAGKGKRKSRIAVVRNTMPQLRDTTMKTWFDWFPNGSLGTYHGLTKTYHIRKDDIDCEVIFRALDDPSDVANLLSLELTGGYLNEFRDIHREIAEGIDGRIGRYPRMQEGGPSWIGLWGDSNMPEEYSYWWAMLEGYDPDDMKVLKPNNWEKFVQPPGVLSTEPGVYVTNPAAENLENLIPGYYEKLVEGKTDDYIRTYVRCQYGRSKGGKPVHPMYNPDVHVAKQVLVPNPANLLLIGCDFGLTPAMVLKQQDALGRVLTFDAIATFGMGLERAIETKLLPLLRRKYDGFEVFVTGDPSGNRGAESDETSCVDVLRRYKRKGLDRVKMAWSNNPIHRQGATDHFLGMLVDRGMPAYQVCPGEGTADLRRALAGNYRFKIFKDGRQSGEVEKNDASHIGEANEYADMHYHRGGQRKAEQRERALMSRAVAPPPNIYATPR